MGLNGQLFKIGFVPVKVFDIIDILLVTYVLFKLYMIMRRTRAVQMFFGLLIIVIVSFIAQATSMQGISWIFRNLRTVWIVAFVILFQPELRRILTLMGQSRVIRFFTKEQTTAIIEEVVQAVLELSKRGYGALIVIARDTGLKTVIETGVQLQANVTSQLLISLFNPKSPLHDGAVVIRNDILEAAKCLLPINRSPHLERKWGTRHRAAIGMSEESDALIIVVSEETGTISVAEHGEIKSGFDYYRLHDTLNTLLQFGLKKSE